MQLPKLFGFGFNGFVDAFLFDELTEVLQLFVRNASVNDVDYITDELFVIVCKVLNLLFQFFYLNHCFVSFRLFLLTIRRHANNVPVCHFGTMN